MLVLKKRRTCTSGSTSSADGAEEFWRDYTKHKSLICYKGSRLLHLVIIMFGCVNYSVFQRVLPQGKCRGYWLVVLRKSLEWDQLWNTLSKSSSASVSIHTGMYHFLCINRQLMQSTKQDFSCETHHPLLLLGFTLGKGNGQLQLLLLLQCCLVSLGGHLVREQGKNKIQETKGHLSIKTPFMGGWIKSFNTKQGEAKNVLKFTNTIIFVPGIPLILIFLTKIFNCDQCDHELCSVLISTYSLNYLWLLGQRTGQVLWWELSRGWGGGFAVSFPKGRREGGVAGEEKGSGRTNNLLNQRRTCCLKHQNLS